MVISGIDIIDQQRADLSLIHICNQRSKIAVDTLTHLRPSAS